METMKLTVKEDFLFSFSYDKITLFAKKYVIDPTSTVGGGGLLITPQFVFLPVTFLFLSQFPPNLVTLPKI